MKEILRLIAIVTISLIAIVFVPVAGLYLAVDSQVEPVRQVASQQQSAPVPPTANEIIALVNDEREARGVAPLSVHAKLNASAKAKADDLVKYKYFEHKNPETGMSGITYVFESTDYALCKYAGENLVRGVMSSPHAVDVWLDSPSHKQGMLDARYELTGVSVVKNYDGTDSYIAVQHFCDVY